MDTKFLKKCMKEIKVTNLENEDVEVVNGSPLEMIGKGRQGAVFKLTDDICVKVFGNEEDCEREYYALSLGQQSDLFSALVCEGRIVHRNGDHQRGGCEGVFAVPALE